MDICAGPSLNVISLCSGGGGLDLALELAVPSARPVVFVEREAFAIHRLVQAFDEGRLAAAPIWSDVTTFAGRPWRGLVDGLIGGIPCQPHSLAGKRGGSTDERDLWTDALRIIARARPWFVLIENVGGMLSAGADEVPGAHRVRRDLFRMGYAVEGGLFTAEEVGFPHERERIFILGVADADSPRSEDGLSRPAGRNGEWPKSAGPSDDCGAMVHPDSGGHHRGTHQPQRGPQGGAAAERAGEGFDIAPPGPSDRDAWAAILAERPDLAPAISGLRRVADGVDYTRIDELRLLGNGVHPLEGAYAIRTLAARLSARGSPGATFLVSMMIGAIELVRLMGVEP